MYIVKDNLREVFFTSLLEDLMDYIQNNEYSDIEIL
jgi:hypothetical protein